MNMSYCAFENTSGDITQCAEKLEELIMDGCETLTDFSLKLNEYEFRGLKSLVSTCREIVEMLDRNEIHL